MEKTIDEMIDFFLFENGEDILVNEISSRAVVLDAVEKINEYDDKIVHIKEEVKSGDVITYKGLKHLITSQIDKNKNSYCARMRRCNHRIAFNWLGNIKWFDCIEESKVFDVSTGTYISVASGNIYVTVQYNSDTRNIALNNRFFVTNQPFKVTGIDKSQEGLIKLNCTLDFIDTVNDDVENNIVDRWRFETSHTYTLSINNGNTANVLTNDVIQLNLSATDNGTAVANPVVTFTSSDSNTVSVDNTGKVMGIALGQAIVTSKLTYHDTISDSITITTVQTLTHSYTIDITGSTTIKLGRSESYVSHIYDNGSEVFDKSVIWSVRNQDGTTTPYATIIAFTGNSCTVKAASSSAYLNKYVVLKAVLSDDATAYKEFIIQLKSLF